MQTKQKWALTLTMALGAISCGGSTQPGDAYQGFIDGTALDSKFQPPSTCGSSGRDKCPTYKAMQGYVDGVAVPFYNLGFVADGKDWPKDSSKRPVLPTSMVKVNAYDFPEGCAAGKEFEPRTDAYRQDVQYTVFEQIPASSSSSTPVLPVVKVRSWTGTAQHTCNDIKSAQSLRDGEFGGSAAEGGTFTLRPVIDMSLVFEPLSKNSTFAPSPGWFNGMQLTWLNGGELQTETVKDANNNDLQAFKVMDAVQVKKPSTTASPPPSAREATLVLQARPGDPAWSPVVRVREFVAPVDADLSSFKRLCYDAPCPADAIDVNQQATTYLGVLFVVSSQQ